MSTPEHIPTFNWTVGFLVYPEPNHRPGTGLWQSARITVSETAWFATRYSTLGTGTREAAIEGILDYYPNHVVIVQDERPVELSGHHRLPMLPCDWLDEVHHYQGDGAKYASFLDRTWKRRQSAERDREYQATRMARRAPLTAAQALREAAGINKPVQISVPIYLRSQ